MNRKLAVVALTLSAFAGMSCSDGETREASGVPLAATTPAAAPAPEREPQSPAPGFNPYYSPALRPVGPLRVGRGVAPDGRVPDAERTDVLMTYDTIHISVAASELPAGTLGRLVIYDAVNDVPVWRDERRVSAGMAHLNFDLGPGDLPPNRYRAVLNLGGSDVAERAFQVKDG